MDAITFPENLQTTCGLSILLHGVFSLPDATSYDKWHFIKFRLFAKIKTIFRDSDVHFILKTLICDPLKCTMNLDSQTHCFKPNGKFISTLYTEG